MKALVFCAVSALAAWTAPTLAADASPACAAKRAQIEAQISEATAQGNKQQVAGLQKALKANKANCSDASLAAERDKQIKAAQKKVASREKSLREAEQKGDAKKIADRKAKLEAAKAELVEAEKPLLP
jgi:hypothetical protein